MIDLKAANHTNRELDLMLQRKKPLAMFMDEQSFYPDDEIFPETQFLPYVQSGQFVHYTTVIQGEYVPALGREAQWKYLFYYPRRSCLENSRDAPVDSHSKPCANYVAI